MSRAALERCRDCKAACRSEVRAELGPRDAAWTERERAGLVEDYSIGGGERLEHGLSPDAGVRRWQERLNPVWNRLAGGCNLNRKIDALLAATGFRVAELREAYLPGPRPLTYTYEGSAI